MAVSAAFFPYAVDFNSVAQGIAEAKCSDTSLHKIEQLRYYLANRASGMAAFISTSVN